MKQIASTHKLHRCSLSRLAIAVAAMACSSISWAQSTEPAMIRRVTDNSLSCGKWAVVKSANGPSKNNQLYGVSASAANNVWAVGGYQSGTFGPFQTLTERWNGKAWSVVPSANAGAEDTLYGVAVNTPTDVWAVGYFMPQLTSPQSALIEHWNGQKWSVVPNPRPGQLSVLSNVQAVSRSDVWAVGFYYNNAGNSQTLIEHWNGRKWSVVPSPSPGLTDNLLNGLAVVSDKNIWTDGYQSSDDGNSVQTLFERWDGKSWSVVSSNPSPCCTGGMTALHANDVWAVGGYENDKFIERTLAEHWDGQSWKVVRTPNVGQLGNSLSSVAMAAGSDVWAVGSYFNSGIARTLIERWDGKQWKVVPSPNPGTQWDELHHITTISNTLWTVGYFENSNIAKTLVASMCF